MRNSQSYSKSVYYSGIQKLKDRRKIERTILPKVMDKKSLTTSEQIDYMEYKGITFNLTSKEEARRILEGINYYFKLSVYRKLFDKDYSNKYRLLDFKILTDLASIDMGVRYFLLQLTLDVEHSVKVALIKELTKNPRVDDYLIVNQFKNAKKEYFNSINQRFSRTKYMKDFHSKRSQKISYWVLIELLDMGGVVSFLKFYVDGRIYSSGAISTDIRNANKLLIYTKNIRNCTAHSNPFIFNILDRRVPTSNQLISYATNMGIDSDTIRYDKVNDLVALFHLHKYLCSGELSERRKAEGRLLLDRSKRMSEYYTNNEKIKKTFNIFKVLLDYLA